MSHLTGGGQSIYRALTNRIIVIVLLLTLTLTWTVYGRAYIPGLREDITGQPVVVNTTYGQLLGKRRTGDPRIKGVTNTVDWFLGVPYARPPIDNLRFHEPLPPRPWQGVRKAVRHSWVCPQSALTYDFATRLLQDEDCLYLSIYVPYQKDEPEARYPVMLFIHGGSYQAGGSSVYSGYTIAQYGVIVVVINYRLGVLGFLSTKNEALPGNYGLRDQIEALRWVQGNIAAFRGDPSRVTIFGNSAGGSSVGLLTLSPLSEGLFRQAICQSGSPLSFWAMHNETINIIPYVQKLASHLSCSYTALDKMVACLRKLPWSDFIEVSTSDLPRVSPSGTDIKPCIDGVVLPSMPRTLVQTQGIQAKVFMMGTTRDEWTSNMGWLVHDICRIGKCDNNLDNGLDRYSFEDYVDHVITNKFGWDMSVAVITKQKYTDWKNPNDPLKNREEYVKFVTDLAMVAPTVELADAVHKRNIPVYMYSFDFYSPNRSSDWRKSYHSIELNYLFGAPFTGIDVDSFSQMSFDDDISKAMTEEDQEMSRLMMKLWSDFAKYGNPTPDRGGVGVSWHKYRPSNNYYLQIVDQNTTRMRQYIRPDKVSFWNDVVPVLQERIMELNTIYVYKKEMWVFVGISVTLLCLLLVALSVLYNTRSRLLNQTARSSTPPRKV